MLKGRKKYFLALIVLILTIVSFSVFGKRGLIHLSRLNKELQTIEDFSEKVTSEIMVLKKEVSILENEEDPHYLEMIKMIAREDLGWSEKDTLIYQFQK